MGISKHIGTPGRTLFFISVFCVTPLLLLPGCSPRIVERVSYVHDTTNVVRIDSVRYYQRDSVFVKENGDTIYQYVERIRYRDRFRIDTLVQVRETRDTAFVEVKVEKPLTAIQEAKIKAFPWLVGALMILLLYAFRKPLLYILKKWLSFS